MRLKQMVVLLATVALALPLAAQMGMQVPTLSGIWRPVVGAGSVYEITREGNKTNMEFAVIGKEDMGGKTGYWVESSMIEPKGGEVIIKVLETVDGNAISYSKSVIQMPGQGPMEMDMNTMNMGGRRPAQTEVDFRNKAELVGTESVTVPAGTYSCEHYRMKDGSGDGWISDKVSPWSLVKMQDKQRTIVLAKVTTDAKDRITGTPTKFDPMQMMRNRMGQQGQQPQ
ncbi:MAG TPA: hypothetical protein VK770_04255 [Candidatus Acidoferrum sp.]|jgi:hypothetical protein|nr:hypothetical protein [Candidatus Acidoferrum sp.]